MLKLWGFWVVFTGIIEKIKGGFTAFVEFITSHLKAALVIAAAVFFVILLFLILTIISRRSLAEEKRPDTEPAADYAFPVEDFFLPYEPDFVPGVLLEREPRDNWTEEDARPFWTDPMEGNEELWRKRIESGIDSLLEQVP
ncbi:MAG: hypothetical protein LBB72_02550 [Spirochaetaceae bacterium]|jgi:hypothetical protein|nr:hypothetical protein [Spirochaetaceae bacterium]